MRRKSISKAIEQQVLTASRRRCCLCIFLHERKGPVAGQIAHLDRNNQNSKFENLVWLCFQHHHEYDTKSRQGKGLQLGEVRHWRDELYASFGKDEAIEKASLAPPPEGLRFSSVSGYDRIISSAGDRLRYLKEPWRFPLWLNATSCLTSPTKLRTGRMECV